MKALTIHEPYASLIIMGIKKLETRGRKTNVRGLVAIHAGKKPMDADGKALAEKYGIEPQYGKVLGVVNLVQCWEYAGGELFAECNFDTDFLHMDVPELEETFGYFDNDRYAWEMEVVEKFDEPIPAKGMQGWWNWERGA